jgi:hypothetical protein
MKTYSLIAFFITTGIVCQAGVITTTTCTIVANAYGTVAAQNNPSSCSVSYDNSNDPAFLNGTIGPASGNADASISGTFSATSFSFTGHENAFVRGAATALASFNETASLLLDTPGPVRPGFITFPRLVRPFPPPPPTGEMAQLNVGSYSAGCSANGCSGDLAVPTALASVTLPFTLGEEYLFSDTFSSSAGVNAGTSLEFGGGGTVIFSYFLTDADGNVVEPFEVAATPEPASESLCLVGVCLLALSAKRRNCSSSAPVTAL